jgi:hypothetical protein
MNVQDSPEEDSRHRDERSNVYRGGHSTKARAVRLIFPFAQNDHRPLKLSVGGYSVGPVSFTARPDKNFDRISQWMGKTVHGALGGSAFKFFRITVDYPNATAYFEKPWPVF